MGTTLVGRSDVDVSIIMPCLNEAGCLPACIANAREALEMMRHAMASAARSSSPTTAARTAVRRSPRSLGARVDPVARRGYGAALAGGAAAAHGRFLVMGDADGSYDFRDAVAMVGKLMQGADLCMGSRFQGGIEPGAMPWKNRYIGNPILTGILNILFRAGISDAHCGIRALTRSCFDRLQLSGDGMEFASEMVIKAALLGCAIAEVPATLSRDLRDRPPHLRPWRDGWRHLRYLLMLSPTWLFAAPAALFAGLALGILALAGIDTPAGVARPYFGNYWTILAGGLLTVGAFGTPAGRRRQSLRCPRGLSAAQRPVHGVRALGLAGDDAGRRGNLPGGRRQHPRRCGRLLVGATLRAAVATSCPPCSAPRCSSSVRRTSSAAS